MSVKKKGKAGQTLEEKQAGATEIVEQLGLGISMQDGSNRYAMYDELGRGGVGLVYFGMDKALHREVALKILRKRYLTDRGAVAHFLNEAKIMARLDHPGIVPTYDIGFMSNGELFFSMERVRGRTLREVLDDRRSPKDVQRSLSELVGIFEQVCQIVAYAHSRGIVHRDIKPENIMVGEFNTVYVMDWGIARDLNEQKKNAMREIAGTGVDITTLLNARKVKGTPKYMSPEQALGVSDVDFRSDVFSLGLVFYEILTGQHPFEADSMRKILHNIKQKRTPHLRSYFIPNELKSICYKALKKLPEERYPNAGPFALDIHRSLSFQNVSVHKDNPLMWGWKFVRRHMLFCLASVFLVTVAGILSTNWLMGRRYSNKLLEMADTRMKNAAKCRRDIADWQMDPHAEPELRKHKIAKIRARESMIMISARALFCAALKRRAHELSPVQIRALKRAWFTELTYYLQLDNEQGALEAYDEMRADGFLRPDHVVMRWTPDEVDRLKGYAKFFTKVRQRQREEAARKRALTQKNAGLK